MTERDWTGLDRNRRDGKGMDCAGQKRSERDVARRGGAGGTGQVLLWRKDTQRDRRDGTQRNRVGMGRDRTEQNGPE